MQLTTSNRYRGSFKAYRARMQMRDWLSTVILVDTTGFWFSAISLVQKPLCFTHRHRYGAVAVDSRAI